MNFIIFYDWIVYLGRRIYSWSSFENLCSSKCLPDILSIRTLVLLIYPSLAFDFAVWILSYDLTGRTLLIASLLGSRWNCWFVVVKIRYELFEDFNYILDYFLEFCLILSAEGTLLRPKLLILSFSSSYSSLMFWMISTF